MPATPITQAELLDGLAADAARVTVVTPNRRLAQALAAAFDRGQCVRGLARWESADILPLPAFIERCREDALGSPHGARLERLATPDEELALWEDAVRRWDGGERLLAVPETAALARDAWTLLHAWQLQDAFAAAAHDEDAAAFADWAGHYRARCLDAGVTDRARLPAEVSGLLDRAGVRRPARLVAWAFDIVTPQQRAFLTACEAAGIEVLAGAPARASLGSVLRVACADARDELRSAARWSRGRLEADPAARIGIVVPALDSLRDALVREFAQVLAPGAAPGAPLPLNVTLGRPLTDVPVVAHALAVLDLCGREVAFERASLVLRSPFLAGADAERFGRARADAALRRHAEPVARLDSLVSMLEGAPQLAGLLRRLAEYRRARLFGARSPRAWAEAFGEALRQVGFPGERGADSAEFQALGRWHELLAQFGRLERVAPKSGFAEALARLRRIAAGTLFQPESPEAPIQVCGVLEAAGLEFDHLWVMGLSDETWPLHPRVNPFVPLKLQRAAGVPNASPADALALGRRLTAEWLASAGEVVVSHPRREGDRPLAPSPLITDLPVGDPGLRDWPRWRDALHAVRGAATLECIADGTGGALAAGTPLPAGTAVLRDQAACPFRAFARHRLGADALDAPHAGLDAMERGTLVHRVLASVWATLESKAALDASAPVDLEALIAEAARAAVERVRARRPGALGARFAAIEHARLVRLALAWLDHERGRGDFGVVAIEARRELAIGPLVLNARLDRVDQTADGARIVIDYKTGKPTPGALLGARPDEPQLPLYLVAAEPAAAGVAFAQVRAGAMRFVGFSASAGLLPGVKAPGKSKSRSAAEDWPGQVEAWRRDLVRLAEAFHAGHADVDPKNANACDWCDLQPLCRVHERTLETGE